jgi:hypothetical protein
MKVAARPALCIIVCVQPAMAENAANTHPLSLAPEARATILGKTVGEGCVGKTAFYGESTNLVPKGREPWLSGSNTAAGHSCKS